MTAPAHHGHLPWLGSAPVTVKATGTVAVPPMPPALRAVCAAVALGVLAGVVVVWWAGAAGTGPSHFTVRIHDEQARAWLDGRWDLPRDVARHEGYPADGDRAQVYFGVVPALARLPFVATTDAFDGRLTRPSQLVALGVALWATSRLLWTTRWLIRRDRPIEPADLLAGGALVLAVGAGSVLAFLTAWPSVYHETILWALALALAALDQQVRLLQAPSRGRVIGAGVLAGAVVLTRVTVGVAVMIPLILLALLAVVRVAGRRAGERITDRPPVRAIVPSLPALAPHALALTVVALVPLLTYGYVNQSRFDHPWRVPYDQQAIYDQDPERAARMAANDGSLFGPQFLASNFFAYAIDDGIEEVDDGPPFVKFRHPMHTRIIGDVQHDLLRPTPSILIDMPVLVPLAVAGLLALCLPLTRARSSSARLPVMAAALGAAVPLGYAVIAYRFVGDMLPFLVLAAALGLAFLLRVSEGRPVLRRGGAFLGALLVWWSVFVSLSLMQFRPDGWLAL
jgi:hypothetical protein